MLLFQEIIQNAEDAGASCVKFMYNKNDYRQLRGKKYSVNGLQQYQVLVLILIFFYVFFVLGCFFHVCFIFFVLLVRLLQLEEIPAGLKPTTI